MAWYGCMKRTSTSPRDSGSSISRSPEQDPEQEQDARDTRGADEENVGWAPPVRPGGVHSHAVSIVGVVRSALLCRVILATLVLLAGCAGESPDVPIGPDGEADEVLLGGRDVYGARCARCHGASGGGGTGPKLSDGSVVDAYPEIDDQFALVLEGKNAMPSFANRLSSEEIDAVVRYTREVLSQP